MIHKSRPVISSAIFAPSRWIANDCQNLGRLGFIAVGQKAFSKFDRQSQDDNGIVGFLRQLACQHHRVAPMPWPDFGCGHHTIPTPWESASIGWQPAEGEGEMNEQKPDAQWLWFLMRW